MLGIDDRSSFAAEMFRCSEVKSSAQVRRASGIEG